MSRNTKSYVKQWLRAHATVAVDRIIRTRATAEIEAAAGDGKRPRLSILAYNGAIMDVPGFGPTVIDLKGLDLPRQVPILADHDNRLEAVAGHGNPTITRGQLHIAGTLASTVVAQQIHQLVGDGLEFQASVGVKILKSRSIQAGETITANGRTIKADRGFMYVTKGKLVEISIVPIGADQDTAVKIAAKGDTGGDGDDADNAGDSAAAIDKERKRIAAVLTAAAEKPEIAAQAVENGWDVQRTELELLRASRGQIPYANLGYRSQGTNGAFGNAGNTRDILAAATLIHCGRHATAEKAYGEAVCARAEDLRITSALDLCRASLMLTSQGLALGMPNNRAELIQAAFSMNALSGALAAATMREAMQAFQEAPHSWRMICKTRPAPDFRKRQGLRPYLSGASLEEVGKDGEIKHAGINGEFYDFEIFTFAKMFAVDRQTIINDDIGVVMELMQELGRQGARLIADKVSALITSNPGNFFHADNNNLITGADSELSVGGLGLAVKALRQQKDADGKAIDVSPKTLLVPPALEATGRAVLSSQNVLIDGNDSPVDVPGGNPWQNIATLAVDPRLEDDDEWYLFADPANVPAIVVSFLNGQEGPTVEQAETDFNTLGRQFRCYLDMGASVADPRGAVKSNGS